MTMIKKIKRLRLKIILEKIRTIQNISGVSISLAEDNRSVMDKVLKAVLLDPDNARLQFSTQLKLDFDENKELDDLDAELTNEIERAKNKAKAISDIFAHQGIRPDDIKKDLEEVAEAIGDVQTLETFVVMAVRLLGATIEKDKEGYVFRKNNMEQWLSERLGKKDPIHISFESPTPLGYLYIGRNNPFVEQLCHRIIANSLDEGKKTQKAARASVFKTDAVSVQTTLIQFRVRNVIQEVHKKHDIVAEEMYLWGYEKTVSGIKTLDLDICKKLLQESNALDLSKERQESLFANELKYFNELHDDFIKVVEARTAHLVDAHSCYAKYLGAKSYEAVTPVLPPDILGVYVLIPNTRI